MTGTPGLLITLALLTLLVARQVLSAAWPRSANGRRQWWLAPFDLATVPLLVAFVAVVVVRFDRLSL